MSRPGERSRMRLNSRNFLAALLALATVPAAASEIDGTLEPGDCDAAQDVTAIVMVQLLTGGPATLPTEAWVLATPEGLAVAFRNVQPASVPRTTQRTRRDEGGQLDRVNLMVDFDGDGRTGYDFMVTSVGDISDEVITGERSEERRVGKEWR